MPSLTCLHPAPPNSNTASALGGSVAPGDQLTHTLSRQTHRARDPRADPNMFGVLLSSGSTCVQLLLTLKLSALPRKGQCDRPVKPTLGAMALAYCAHLECPATFHETDFPCHLAGPPPHPHAPPALLGRAPRWASAKRVLTVCCFHCHCPVFTVFPLNVLLLAWRQ